MQHAKSERHKTAVEHEKLAGEVFTVGGIPQGFKQMVSLQRKAVLL